MPPCVTDLQWFIQREDQGWWAPHLHSLWDMVLFTADGRINFTSNFCSPPVYVFSMFSYVIVRSLSTVEYTSVASVFNSRQWSDNLIHDRCSCILYSHSRLWAVVRVHAWLDVSTQAWTTRRERESESSYDSLTHSRLYCRDREKK